MENEGLWVFRLSVGEGGNPKSVICPRVDVKSINEYRRDVLPLEEDEKDVEEIEVTYDEIFSFLKSELFEHGRLRQGWGFEFEGINLDLNQSGNIWIENYMKLRWRLWGEKISTQNACGRWNILERMKEMEIGDIVFIPRIRDESKFTVATVEQKYFFQPMENYFGHANVIRVKNIKEYSYEEHFPAKTFNPYRTAISQIKNKHKNYNSVSDFLKEYYL